MKVLLSTMNIYKVYDYLSVAFPGQQTLSCYIGK